MHAETSTQPISQNTTADEDDIRFAASLFGWTVDRVREVSDAKAKTGDERMVLAMVTTIAKRIAWERATIHARYAAVAAALDERADRTYTFLRDHGTRSINHEKRRTEAHTQQAAASQIRRVAAQ